MNDWTLPEFLSYLRSLDIRLGLDGERLACNAPKGAITSEIKRELQLRKPEILEFLRDNPETDIVSPTSTGATTSRRSFMPVSFAQQRLWFLDRMSPGNPMYTIVGVFKLQGTLDRNALERSLHEIIARHDTLQTVFQERNGLPEAKIGTANPWRLHVVDLRETPDAGRQDEAQHQIDAEVARPFDLATGPLIRTTLYLLREQEAILLVTMHHIVADPSSVSIVISELRQLYPAFRDRKPSPLSPLVKQYGDYVEASRRALEGGVLGEQVPFWKATLAAPLPVLELPLDKPRPPVQTFRGQRAVSTLPWALYEAVKEFSIRENVTVFDALLTAYYILLTRYTGQNDLIVGTSIADRHRPEFADLIGFFINTLVLRTDLSGEPTVRECLQRVRNTRVAAFENQDVPFDRLVEILKPERALDRPPLFQTMFAFQESSGTDTRNGVESGDVGINPGFTLDTGTRTDDLGLSITRMELDPGVSRVDLSLDIVECGKTVTLQIEYNIDLFDATTIDRLRDHYQIVLAGMADTPNQRITDVALLTPSEVQQIVQDWNATAVAYPNTICVHELIDAQARRTPDADAVRWEQHVLRYEELVKRANRLAHHLRTLGVGPDTLVGVCVERTHEMVVALLAVWKAGGAYVPLDPLYPQERLSFMANDAKLAALITESALDEVVPNLQCPVVRLDEDRARIDAYPETAPEIESDANRLAYVLYTSGSTGQPKGVMIEHRALVNFLCSMQREPGLSATDTLLSVTTLSFDIAGLELYLPLITGARVVLVSRAVAGDGLRLARAIREVGTTVMQATPATWRLLLDSGWCAGEGLTILCGGEALPVPLARALLETGAELWNLYGPTESTIWSTIHRVELHDDPIPIGRPITNTQLYITDAHLRPVPVNVTGELYIGGDGLARGYLHRPDLTADRFIANPFVLADGGVREESREPRLYRTGDQARYREDGTVEYVGRIDHQVKVRGFRIELGEIESALLAYDGVQQAVVTVREDVPGDQRLVAYIIASAKESGTLGNVGSLGGVYVDAPRTDTETIPSLSSGALRTWLAARLPQFMIPSAFVILEAFPLTPNGKIDRKALQAPDASARTVGSSFVSPRTEAERTVVDIWREVLRIDRVGVNDNFFDLGGHSLLVVQLQSKLRERFNREISLMDLFRRPTVGAIAEFISTPAGGMSDASASSRLAATARERAARQNRALATE